MKVKIEEYIREWSKKGYSEDIPDVVPQRIDELNKAPSYKKIALAIINNDHSMKSLGFSTNSYYYSELKRIEISARKGAVVQLKLL